MVQVLKMQINRSQNSCINFSSAIPIRVFIDGMETFGEKNIKAASRQLLATIKGPVRNNEKSAIIAGKLAQKDPDFDFSKALDGYKSSQKNEKSNPSDFFRVVKGKNNRYFLFTGKQGKHLAALGKMIGKERASANTHNKAESFDLYVAKRNYERYIRDCINNLKLRITEFYNPDTMQKTGKPVVMDILMESNKKYGKTTFKMELADIKFSTTEQNA